MNKFNKNQSYIIKKGVIEAVTPSKMIEGNDGGRSSKQMSAEEVAMIFMESEIEQLKKQYKCLNTTPRALANKINEEVIGQEDAVLKTAFVVYLNQKINLLEELGENAPKRINLLLVGPTGSGKSAIYHALKKNFDVPMIKYSSDSITSAGYIGNKVEHILLRLYEEAKRDLATAERGIIFIDEIDKKKVQLAHDGGRDINGKAVQEELLKILEPNYIDLTLPNKGMISFNTSRLTVILAGAHVGLDEIKKKRLNKKNLGFINKNEEMTDEEIMNSPYINEDFIEFGYIPEFIGRIKMIATLKKLSKEDILKIIYHGKNSTYIENTRFLANILNVEQLISKSYIERIAEELEKSKTGVRELESIMTKMFYPIIQEVMEHNGEYGICTIDDEGHYELEYDDVTYFG